MAKRLEHIEKIGTRRIFDHLWSRYLCYLPYDLKKDGFARVLRGWSAEAKHRADGLKDWLMPIVFGQDPCGHWVFRQFFFDWASPTWLVKAAEIKRQAIGMHECARTLMNANTAQKSTQTHTHTHTQGVDDLLANVCFWHLSYGGSMLLCWKKFEYSKPFYLS